MSRKVYIPSPSDRPDWVIYPESFCRIVDQRLIHLTPWHIMDAKRALTHFEGLARRYPSRALFPFAYLQTNDDVACWEKGMGEQVYIIHDFASPGWENENYFKDFWSWFRAAIAETIDWD